MNVSDRRVASYKEKLLRIKQLVNTEKFQKQSHLCSAAKVDANLISFLVHNHILCYDNEAECFLWDERIPITDLLARTICINIGKIYEEHKQRSANQDGTQLITRKISSAELLAGIDEEPTGADRFLYLVFIAGFVVGLIVGIFAFLLIFN